MAFDDSSLDSYNDVASRLQEFRTKHPDGRLRPADPAMPYHVVRVPCGWCVKCKGNQVVKAGRDWKQCPRCQGSGIRHPDEPQEDVFIVYAAAAHRDAGDTDPGVGMAWEPYPGRTPYTAQSELQNAETSAWGRALLAANVADTRKGVASRDEVRNRAADRDEDGWPAGTRPAEPRPGAATSGPETAPEAAAAPGRTNGTTLDPRKRGAVFAQLGELGIKEPDAQRAILSEILERPVSSRKGLTNEDADKVVAALRKRPRPAREQVAAS